jgi:segregation and condensation protein B
MDKSLEIFKQIIIEGEEFVYDVKEIKAIIEGLLFTAGEPLSIDDISDVLQFDKAIIRKLIDELTDELNYERRGIQIIKFNDKYQLGTRAEHGEFIKRLLKPQNKQSLSKAAVETIAIIAYKQPVTRQSIDSIRGVKSDKIVMNLIEKKLVKEVGKLDAPGKPTLLGTTDEFLRYFGLINLDEMPNIQKLNTNI